MAPRRRGLLHHRPQHQLHEFLHGVLQLLRLLPAHGPRRGLPAPEGSDLRQDSGDAGSGRHRRADAGRAASRSEDRVVRRPFPKHQGALPDSSALPVGARGDQHRGSERPEPARHHPAADGFGSRFDSGRRRRNSGRRRAPPHQPVEVPHAGWMDVHRTAHQLGMRTTDTMMFGCGETIEQRMNHLELVRNLQEETGGFTAFIPWTFQRENTSLGHFVKEEATAVEYLQTLAISRIYLDNFENVQSSWVTQGLKTCQLGLRFGGNDVGSIMIEENVVSAAGAHHRNTEEELRRIIRDAGFVPKQRDTLYRTYFLN